MRRVRLTIEYDGTDFAGWQRQNNAPTVQAHIEDALAEMTQTKVVVNNRTAAVSEAGYAPA